MKRTSIIVGGAGRARIVMDFISILKKSDIKIKAVDIEAKDIHVIMKSTSSLDFLLIDRKCNPETKLILADTIMRKKLKCNLVVFSLSKRAKRTKFYTYFTLKEDANKELEEFVRSNFSTVLRPRPSCNTNLRSILTSTSYFFKDLRLQWENLRKYSPA